MSDLPAGWFYPGDIVFYRQIYRDLVPAGGRTAEVGVYRGRSLISVADIIKDKNLFVYAIDQWTTWALDQSTDVFERCCESVKKAGLDPNVKLLRGDSVEQSRQFSNKLFDFVFIDADHSYEAVAADIAAWEPKVRPGGAIGGHDYSESGVIRAVDERYGTRRQNRPYSSIWLVHPVGEM